jgi:integrase
MATSTEPLTRAELAQLLERLPTFEPRPGYYEGLDARQVVLFLLRTGAHPSVLAEAGERGLRLDGTDYVTWTRPKNGRRMRLPLDPSIRPWIAMFLATLPRRTTQTYNVLVHEVGVHCGLPGLTPRTLRHTFLRLLADKTRDIDDVMRYGGCSLAVAVGYVRTTDSERDKAILEGL